MEVFQKEITVSKTDLDQLNHVNNVRYIQWIQDIAEAHWLKNVSSKLLENYIWVLVKHTIEYKNQAFLNDKILIKTFIISSKGATSLRKVEMYNQTTSKLIINSETKWCLLNAKTHRPARITTEIIELFN